MVPIHDTDVAEERWKKTEWRQFEFWDEVETRFRRQKKLWIVATVLIFILLSSIPVIQTRSPYWAAQAAAQKLARVISQLKREAAVGHVTFRLRFKDLGQLQYEIEKLNHCTEIRGILVRKGALVSEGKNKTLLLMSQSQGEQLDLHGLTETFCFDPLKGSDFSTQGIEKVGFAILPVKDLAEKKTDRLSVLIVQGASAEISFD
jgi:hypothetical protein